jgi:hypothetical protein
MFEVIISTISTGRVQRKGFDGRQQARRCADRYDAMRSRTGNRVYVVEIEYRELPAIQPIRSAVAAQGAAA